MECLTKTEAEQGHQPAEARDRVARLAAVEDCKRLVRVKACSDCARFRRTGCVWLATHHLNCRAKGPGGKGSR